MYSISRRLERYRIIYARKIINGDTPNCGLTWGSDTHKGTIFNIPYSPNGATPHIKNIRLNSFQVQGPELFNSLPKNIRESRVSADGWKEILDKYLNDIPDMPYTIDLDSGLCDRFTSDPTNSLLEWIPHLFRN